MATGISLCLEMVGVLRLGSMWALMNLLPEARGPVQPRYSQEGQEYEVEPMQIRSLTGSLHLKDPESHPPPRFFSEPPLVLPPQPLPPVVWLSFGTEGRQGLLTYAVDI